MLRSAPRKEGDVTRAAHAAEAGDLVVVSGHRVGEMEQIGEILEVLGELPHEAYRVRWEDGHESVFRPGSDATIKHATHRRSASAER
jgi:Domain of unknown function (DUF1918)